MRRVITIICVVLFFSACSEDFLQKNKLGEQSIETYYTSETEAIRAVNGVYSTLRHLRYCSSEFVLGDIMSDDAVKGSTPTDGIFMSELKEFRATATNTAVVWKWTPLWRGVYDANLLLKNISKTVMDENMKKRIIAEAKFLRALYYFDLVRTWGDVPLMTEPLNPDLSSFPKRTPKADVYAQVEKDLKEAALDLPLKSQYKAEDMGRATQGAAYALLAKVSLYQEKWDDVKIYANKVFASNVYALDPSYENVFSLKGENGSESIFEIQFNGNADSGFGNTGNFSTIYVMPRLWGWGFRQPTQDLVNEYEPGDPRLKATIMTYAEAMEEEKKDPNIKENVITDDITGYYGKKNYLKFSERPASFRDSPVNQMVIRLADLYLMYAEACVKAPTKDEAGAKEYLEKVRARARAGQNILPYVSATGDALLQAIYHERRVELALESQRFWDLLRTKRYSKLDANFKVEVNTVFPIPQGDISKSNGMLTQNPGY